MVSLFIGSNIEEESLGPKNLILSKKQPNFVFSSISVFFCPFFLICLKKYTLPTNPLYQDSMWMRDVMTFTDPLTKDHQKHTCSKKILSLIVGKHVHMGEPE